eukprot:CAMPEP_0204866218 /NCGR_PEP_ID=MMETSP1348-20121228/16401_1 /ASSEMBLY_ACC=CAM_ASM_000700 /TAXON_ID=215587 /ORGANISM="Aplanochytrium stocchinoi, Strain GSBS06" /LENGTH=318 /DNA_ID=CAMNT_0052017997 /DNA_START=196 /DNA_END=1152 /DNA_ORIENTATION=-
MVLLFYQNTICVVMLLVARELGFITFENLELPKVKAWVPLNILFVLMLATGTYSLKMLSVPMVTVFKNSNNVVITLMDFLVYRNMVSRGVAATLGIMLVAAVLAAKNDLEFTPLGYFWTAANCACTAAFVLYMPKAMSLTKLSSMGKVFYNNLISIPLIIVLDVLMFGDFMRFFSSDLSEISIELQLVLFLSGVAGFALSASSFQCMYYTSPTTYSLIGSLNKIPLTLIGVWLFATKMTLNGAVYIGLSLLAGVVFAYTKSMDKENKKSTNTRNVFEKQNSRDYTPEEIMLLERTEEARLRSTSLPSGLVRSRSKSLY